MDDLSLADATSRWVEDLRYVVAKEKEIQKLRRADKYVSVYRAMRSDRVRIVCVLYMPPALSCRRCNSQEHWSFGDEPDLYRCSHCFPRPTRATERDVAFRLLEKRLENLVRSRVPVQLIVEFREKNGK
jgi:hypothetical protein